MTSGGWHSQEQLRGRHRRGLTATAWTPAVRPTDTGPAHARRDGAAFRPMDTAPAWSSHRSEVLTRRPGWPVDEGPVVPFARSGEPGGLRHASPVAWPTERDMARIPEPLRAERSTPRHAAVEPPKRKTVSADMYFDTAPMGRVRHLEDAVVHALPETTATGLRKFDLGNVPASVTPPRTWRKAVWFAVGTSAAVVLALAVASAELMGRQVEEPSIDALPAYPTGPLTLDKLPHQDTTTDPTSTRHPSREPSVSAPVSEQAPPHHTVIGDTSDGDTAPPDTTTGRSEGSGTSTNTADAAPTPPTRHTVGPRPITPTDPQKMGDVTEQYFQAVANDPAAAHALTTGTMAREGAEGIETRYDGVRRVEVQDITIDRNNAVTTSRVKVVHDDGSTTVENRKLTFTWGGNPKITEDSTTA